MYFVFMSLLFYCQTPEGTVSILRRRTTIESWEVEKGAFVKAGFCVGIA